MARIERTDVGGLIYHVLNRANARAQIFNSEADYAEFEKILEEGAEKFAMRILAYCLMPNHWHLVLYPRLDGDLSRFMSWITNTHTRRWHTIKGTIGQGHLYQGRYKSFICQADAYFLTLVRYVERNAKKANLVPRAELWQWSSVWRRMSGTQEQKKLLSSWPIPTPTHYLNWLNEPQSNQEEEWLEQSISKNIPFGSKSWQSAVVTMYGLEQSIHGVGRPKNGG